jgi:hypothetical protein
MPVGESRPRGPGNSANQERRGFKHLLPCVFAIPDTRERDQILPLTQRSDAVNALPRTKWGAWHDVRIGCHVTPVLESKWAKLYDLSRNPNLSGPA